MIKIACSKSEFFELWNGRQFKCVTISDDLGPNQTISSNQRKEMHFE